MKILFLCTSDTHGGAARAAYRLFVGLREQGIIVKMLVRDKQTNDPDVIPYQVYDQDGFMNKFSKLCWKIKNRIRKHKWKKYPNREDVFLNDLDSVSLLQAIRTIDFDILHLHFVANRFLDLRELNKINKPIVWTLHDSWAFTGICHFFYDCKRYKMSCGCCPMLHSIDPNDLSHNIWKIKYKLYSECNLHIVTPSNWLGVCAKQSSLLQNFPLTIIPNGIDIQQYQPVSIEKARLSLGLKENTIYLLFGAVNAVSDKNKGFDLLQEALKYLKCNVKEKIELIVIGADKPTLEEEFGFKTTYLGVIKDENKMVEIYNAANVVIVPSRSENFSNTILESMSCGTPVVSFDIGGNSDLIDHKKNGYLAKSFDALDMANGISWCVENNINNELSINAQTKVKINFSSNFVIKKYIELYTILFL